MQKRSTNRFVHFVAAVFYATFAFAAVSACAQSVTFSVGVDQTPSIPNTLTNLPDEHTTFIPPQAGSSNYLVFGSSSVKGGSGGTVALQTPDLQNFSFVPGYPQQVMTPPLAFTACKASYDDEFDLNYAAPGSVVQDPTLPAGNLIMLYEAENHCPGAVSQQPFYATIGVARSSDNGKTWPAPVDNVFGGTNRYPGLKSATVEPSTAEVPPQNYGDAIPSAITVTYANGDSYVYVVYSNADTGSDGMLRLARAKLGGTGQLSFFKWYNGAFTEPGVGGNDTSPLPSRGCTGPQNMGSLYYSELLQRYLWLFACTDTRKDAATGLFPAYQAAWYFSLATDPAIGDWTTPQIVAGSLNPVVSACASDGSGRSFDGWYPSMVSPGAAAGHINGGGMVFFMNGCDTGKRSFNSRSFTMTAQAAAGSTPQSGVWWNPAEGGRGYTLEFSNGKLFIATFMYDVSGRSHWYGAGPAPMGGNSFSTALTAYSGGQTLTGAYKAPTQGNSPSNIAVNFSDASHATITWVGGTIPIERFEFVTGGLGVPPTAVQPQTGWWWNPGEGGRGFFVEVQNNQALIATYMYDNGGNPVWYDSGPAALPGNIYQSNWNAYTGGQTLTGTYQAPTGPTNAGALTIQFASPTSGTLTLPNGRQIPLVRFPF